MRAVAEKRGSGQVRGESVFGVESPLGGGAGIEQVLGREPTPELAAQVVEQCDHLMDLLDDPSLRLMARLKLEGYTNQEISRSLDCAVGTVERKLARIRHKWSKEVEP